jgi:hypothetical protein
MLAGDYRLSEPEVAKCGARRPATNTQKPAIGGPFCERQDHFVWRRHCLAGAGGFEPRCCELESDALDRPRGAAEPLFAEIQKSFETLEFREPYRICGVQSFGEKWAFRRIMSAPCRVGVQSSNEKSLLLLGLIANEFARRTHGLGRSGGAREIRTRGTASHSTSARRPPFPPKIPKCHLAWRLGGDS